MRIVRVAVGWGGRAQGATGMRDQVHDRLDGLGWDGIGQYGVCTHNGKKNKSTKIRNWASRWDKRIESMNKKTWGG